MAVHTRGCSATAVTTGFVESAWALWLSSCLIIKASCISNEHIELDMSQSLLIPVASWWRQCALVPEVGWGEVMWHVIGKFVVSMSLFVSQEEQHIWSSILGEG